jgi:hypothetical protein
MGKKRIRKTKTSKGTHSNVATSTLRLVAAAVDPFEKALNKIRAWRAGKNPWVTIKNPDGSTNRPFIKVKANSLYGNPKFATSGLFKGKDEE